MLSWYDWGFDSSTGYGGTTPIPNWFWLMAAVNIFLAYTLDGIDGKQARRIGLSGPLGELFDHGLDSYTGKSYCACTFLQKRQLISNFLFCLCSSIDSGLFVQYLWMWSFINITIPNVPHRLDGFI